ncbi:hypothetical protein MKW98_022953 [Papaver atlanticum]|uniref:TraB domain-containing protein n=1 Tax=Papaver atlanticum TaxID=357466 RepID=A0AAD4TA53_9MAGN|nr:hypothetical protein MKW98_022953 [Papaver atlanticum]
MLLSSIFIRLTGVSSLTHFTTTQRAPPCYVTHYQHGIPGIPTDGKVFLLKNSDTGSQIYLVGTNHIEQTEKETEQNLRNPAENVNESWFSIFGCLNPIGRWYHSWRGVAIEECLKLNAKLIPIDRELGYFHIEFPWKTQFQRHIALWKYKSKEHLMEKGSRSYVREITRVERILVPELYKLFIEDRDKHMFIMLRRMEERLIVAVVGMGHMDGIELLWKRAEDGDDDQLLLATSENGGPPTGYSHLLELFA